MRLFCGLSLVLASRLDVTSASAGPSSPHFRGDLRDRQIIVDAYPYFPLISIRADG
jgi:hypothetical protein